jgi:hypothetical protein
MGVEEAITADRFPAQSTHVGTRVQVCFHYDTTRLVGGTIVRDDTEEPGKMIIRLDDGRHVLASECLWRPDTKEDTGV